EAERQGMGRGLQEHAGARARAGEEPRAGGQQVQPFYQGRRHDRVGAGGLRPDLERDQREGEQRQRSRPRSVEQLRRRCGSWQQQGRQVMDKWNPWKVTALGLVLVMATALVTGLVVANWSGTSQDAAEQKAATSPASRPAAPSRVATAPHAAPAPRVAQAPATPAVPTQDVVAACNRYAAGQAGDQNKTTEVVKDATIGAGKVGEGVEETAKGIGNTVVEGAKYSGAKLKESGKAAEPKAKSAWESVRDGTVDFGHSVKNFFSNLFGG